MPTTKPSSLYSPFRFVQLTRENMPQTIINFFLMHSLIHHINIYNKNSVPQVSFCGLQWEFLPFFEFLHFKLRCRDSWLLEPCLMRAEPSLTSEQYSVVGSLSVGEPMLRLDMEEDKFMLEETLRVLGYWDMSCSSPSSTGRQVSTIASRQFTNSSALSRFVWD